MVASKENILFVTDVRIKFIATDETLKIVNAALFIKKIVRFPIHFSTNDSFKNIYKIKLNKRNKNFDSHLLSRSSRSELFCKKDGLRKFAKFTGKQLCQSLFFNKVAALRPVNFL